MGTNYLPPFANGSGANVLDYASWMTLADQQTGFQSGIARSIRCNFPWAEGAAAAHAIGSVVVANTNADATIDATALATNFGNSVVQVAVAQTITGAKTFSGATTVTGTFKSNSLLPRSTNSYDLGSSSVKWRNVYATTFTGNLTGTATKATGDADGNTISTTYAKLASANTFSGVNTFSGRTILNGRTDFTILYITDGTNTHSAIRNELTASSYGSNVSFGAGGSTFITSGESSGYITEDNGFSSASEHVQLLADSQIYFRPDLNSGWDSSKGAIMSSGVFRPLTNAGMSLGNSSYKWNNVYANGFVGDLTGTASQATADATGATISTTYVHLAGAETITGVKTFTNDFVRQFKTFTKGTTPSSSQYISIRFTDANAAALGGIQSYVDTDGATRVRLYSYKNDPNSTDFKAMGVINPLTGSAYAYCPSTPAGSNSNQIATADFVVGFDSNAVHKTGDESITGVKTFENYLVIDRTDQTPTEGEQVGAINFRYKNPDGTTITIYPFQYIAGTNTSNNSLALGSSNGATIIGAGEGGKRIYATNSAAANSESLFLAADSSIYTYAGVSNDGSGGTLVSTQSASGATFSVPLNAPTAAAGTSTTQVATTEFVSSGFLPLSGGAMTGAITSAIETTVAASRATGNVWVARANRTDTGKGLSFGVGSAGQNRGLYDISNSKWGFFLGSDDIASSQLAVSDTSDDSASHLASTGWVKDVLADYAITSALSAYLPLAGGTMTGTITSTTQTTIKHSSNTASTQILGGTSANYGAYLRLDGQTGTYKGGFRLAANDSSSGSRVTTLLYGTPAGSLTWGGKELATQEWVKVSAKGSRTTNGNWSITGLEINKPLFILHQKSGNTGVCTLAATSGVANGGKNSNQLYNLGKDRTDVAVFVPSAATVVIACGGLADDGDELYAYQ